MFALRSIFALCAFALLTGPVLGQGSFVNWESPHVHPLELEPGASRLLVVNTPDGRLELFDLSTGLPIFASSIPVGIDPVSVRARPGAIDEAWVVNHVSDSVSVLDLALGTVVATLATDDEPTDVVFAGNPLRAFVSCSQANTVLVFDPADLSAPPARISIAGEDPRAMCVSPDGGEIYVAIFESGNGTTILGGGLNVPGGFPPNVVSDSSGPHGGVNPPPNDGGDFDPPIAGALPTPPPVGMIVRKDGSGSWMDDNGGNWTSRVSGSQAAQSGRPIGWDLPDRDIAKIDANTLSVSYVSRLMNMVMGIAVNPATGELSAVGTDATNEVRFEPVLNGRFLRVNLALVDPAGLTPPVIVDLNPHLDYSTATIPQFLRNLAVGDPRSIVWESSGTRAWVSGMGSNNVISIGSAGSRDGLLQTVEVGEGPTGLALDEARSQLYVLNRFAASISVINTSSEVETARISIHDASDSAIKIGRKHLFDTHKNSGLGHVSCASCHVDARMDRLAWDLGNPAGAMKSELGQNLGAGLPNLSIAFQPWHPMKGPMTTQTLQDIIGKEPLHWRGDKDGLEEFNGAFIGLQGDDQNLNSTEMQEFEDYLATIHYPPNPFRNFDNSLPDNLPLPGHFTTGRFLPAGQPLPNGDAISGLALFRPPSLLDGFACATCHTAPTGVGTNYTLSRGLPGLNPFPIGPDGEEHHALVSVDGSSNITLKVPQLRNLYEKTGFELTQLENTAGFGFLHDGSVDSLARFFSEPFFAVESDQDIADLVALMLTFSGSDLPVGSASNLLEPPGPSSQDAHAAVGRQMTLDTASPDAAQASFLAQALTLADAGSVGLVVHGRRAGETRGWTYLGSSQFQSDRASELHTLGQLRAAAGPGTELTFTVVAQGTELRIGIDRDEDGFLNRDEVDAGADPADDSSFPTPCQVGAPAAPTGLAASVLDKHRIALAWSDNSGEEAGYRVERRSRGRGSLFKVVAELPADSTDFTDIGLDCWRRFTYRVSAFNCAGAIASPTVSAQTQFCLEGAVSPPLRIKLP